MVTLVQHSGICYYLFIYLSSYLYFSSRIKEYIHTYTYIHTYRIHVHTYVMHTYTCRGDMSSSDNNNELVMY